MAATYYVAWLQISVQDICCMDVFHTPEYLIQEVLIMTISERLATTDDSV